MRNSILIESIMLELFCVENSEGLKIFTETINSVKSGSKAFFKSLKVVCKNYWRYKSENANISNVKQCKKHCSRKFEVFYIKLICVELVGL